MLALLGLYGVVAYGVTLRTREIGIRTALGAQPAEVLRLVLGQSLCLTAVGVALGLGGAAAATRYLEGMLFGLTPTDAGTFIGVTVAFPLVAAGRRTCRHGAPAAWTRSSRCAASERDKRYRTRPCNVVRTL